MSPLLLKGSCLLQGSWAGVFTNLAERLGHRIPVELSAIDNEVAPGYPLTVHGVTNSRDFGLVIGQPTHLQQLPTHYRILYTMYEARDLPPLWPNDLCEADEAWTPSKFCGEVLRSYHPKVRVVPLGFDERVFYRKRGHDRNAFWALHCPEALGKKVIGTAGVLTKRKGLDLLLRAFAEAPLEDAVLLLKKRGPHPLPELPEGVFVLDGDWPAESMADFYRSCDLCVFPSRGEGFLLPPLEAAACGTPCLVTRATGPLEYIDDRGIYGIEIAGWRKTEGMFAEDALWAEPSRKDLVDKLSRYLYGDFGVEHGYRQWSWAEVVNRWVAEIAGARRRAGR